MSGFDLDHAGILVRDLDQAAAQFRRLGFQLTPRGYHTLPAAPGGKRPRVGTGNNCAMLERGYVELIGITDPHYEGRLRADLEAYQGLHLIAFGTTDAKSAVRAVRAAGLDAEDPRIVERPIEDGGREELARFEIVDFAPDTLPGSHLFAIRHATPELLWKPALLAHPNGAIRLEAVTIAAEDPAETARRFGRLLSATPTEGKLSLVAGCLRFVDGPWIAAHIPGGAAALPFIAGLALGVRDLGATARWLTAAGVPFDRYGQGLRVAPADACGAFLEFVA